MSGNLDCRQAQFAAVGERERAAVAYHGDGGRADCRERAGLLGGCAQRGKRQGGRSQDGGNHSVQAACHAAELSEFDSDRVNTDRLNPCAPRPVMLDGPVTVP